MTVYNLYMMCSNFTLQSRVKVYKSVSNKDGLKGKRENVYDGAIGDLIRSDIARREVDCFYIGDGINYIILKER